jgi:hypothetical protein
MTETELELNPEPSAKEKRSAHRAFVTEDPGPYYDPKDVERWYYKHLAELENEHNQ